MSTYRYALAEHTSEEIEATARLLGTVFPRAPHLTPDYLKWMYASNPAGAAVACNAWFGDELVGHMAAIPLEVRVENDPALAMIMQNGAIHPEHRGRRLQSNISAAMFEEGTRRGYAYCLGIGNRYSTGPLLTRFEFLRPLEARLGVGPLLRRRGAFTASAESIWSEDAIAWRMANPRQRYSVRRGRVLSPTGWPAISAILHEDPELPDAGPRPPGPLRLFVGLDPSIDFARSAYVSIPSKIRPSPLNLVWRNLAGNNPAPDPARFVLRPTDLDVY